MQYLHGRKLDRTDGCLTIGHDVTIGRYLTPETIRLGFLGLAAGSAAGFAWRVAGRARWGVAPFLVAVLTAAGLAGRTDWPGRSAVVAGVFVASLSGLGAARLLAGPAIAWQWVAAGSIISAMGVWAGVPETGPAVLAGGSLTGLAAAAILSRSRWAPAAGFGAAALLSWAAMSGAAGRPWAAVGGALCTGVAPWFALPSVFPKVSRRPGPGLLGAHMVVVLLAARWIAVDPDPGWARVAVVVAAGLVVAAVSRARA